MDIHISCTDYVELNSLQEVLKNLTVATSISVTKPLSVKAIKPYEAWHLGFLEIESGALSVQHWIAVFTLVTSKLSQDVFKMCLVKCTLNDGINLTSKYWICLCIFKLLFITSVVSNSPHPFQERETFDLGWEKRTMLRTVARFLGLFVECLFCGSLLIFFFLGDEMLWKQIGHCKSHSPSAFLILIYLPLKHTF